MLVRIIGPSGSMSGPRGAASCYLVQARGDDARTYSLALDIGPGSFGQLWSVMEPAALDALALSHLHIDHCGDIMSMQVYRRWRHGSALAPLPLFGPAGTVARLRQLDGFAGNNDFSTEFAWQGLADGASFRVGPMTVTAYSVWHSVPAFGFRIQGPGEDGGEVTVTYTGDTDLCEGVQRAAGGADLLLSECGFTDADDISGIHMNGERAGTLAASAGVGRLVLTHIQPWTDPRVCVAEARRTWAGRLDVARAGDVYRV